MKKLKADLHVHCAEDPLDRVEHSAEQLIETAAQKEFDAICIANHRVITYNKELSQYAERQGIVLIPGIEKPIEGKHVLLVNVDWRVHAVETFHELRRWKRDNTLVIAPHPYYPKGICLRSALERNIDLFDAIEYSFFYSGFVNFNERARKVAEKYTMPTVGSSDCHDIRDLGLTYTLIDSEKNVDAILNAVRNGKTEVVTKALTFLQVCARGVSGVVGSLIEATLKQTYGRITGSLPFEAKALAYRCRKEQRGV